MTLKQHSIEGMIDPTIQKGSILVYRVFDIAEEVNLPLVQSILNPGGFQSGQGIRLSLSRVGRNTVIMKNAPIRLNLGEMKFKLANEEIVSEASATIWDYGVLSILFQIPITEGMKWSHLIPKGAMLNGDTPGGEDLDQLARKKAHELQSLLKTAIRAPNDWKVFEDYVIYFLESLDGISKTNELIEKAPLAELLLGESNERLGSRSRNGILENVYQYAENDLVVIDWNSAIVVEPSGSRDITDVIEFALTHLLEFRYYDDLLDDRLTSLYDSIEEGRSKIFRTNFSRLSNESNTKFIEFSEFIERVDNSLKVVGDFYLAVLYRGAMRRFRIQDWQQSITRKMNLLARVSQLLQSETNVYRGYILEIIIILLIAFEIIQAIVKTM